MGADNSKQKVANQLGISLVLSGLFTWRHRVLLQNREHIFVSKSRIADWFIGYLHTIRRGFFEIDNILVFSLVGPKRMMGYNSLRKNIFVCGIFRDPYYCTIIHCISNVVVTPLSCISCSEFA